MRVFKREEASLYRFEKHSEEAFSISMELLPVLHVSTSLAMMIFYHVGKTIFSLYKRL